MKRLSIISGATVVVLSTLPAITAAVARPAGRTGVDAWLARGAWNPHILLFWMCVVVCAGVFGLMLYSVIRQRKSGNPGTPHFHGSTWIELIWTILPFCILVGAAVPIASTVLAQDGDSETNSITMQLAGHQQSWFHDHPSRPTGEE